jgi:hypothetical protein
MGFLLEGSRPFQHTSAVNPRNEDLVAELKSWFSRTGAINVVMKEDRAPENDPYPDYVLECIVTFEPASLEKARIEIWLESRGYVAVGIEHRRRIAERVGVRTGSGVVFCAGTEPSMTGRDVLKAVLNCAASGDFEITARTFAGRLAGVTVEPRLLRSIGGRGCFASLLPTGRTHRLTYRSWSARD